MPTFETPEPISATIDVVMGDVRIVAGDRTDTAVEVRPTDPSRKNDVTAAELTRVEFSDGELLVKTSKRWRHYGPRDGGSVEVVIELPAGSQVQAESAMGDFRGEGRLGECRFRTAMGAIRLDATGPLNAKTATGAVTVDHVAGPAEVATGSGELRIRLVDGAGVFKNSNGGTKIGEIGGDARLSAANGGISVERAHNSVHAKTANGDIRIGEVARGTVTLGVSVGELEIGIREGTAAYLDLDATAGRVHNALDSADAPAESEETVEVRARTVAGDIVVRRSSFVADE
ncbi:DUF4097 family beta strand repeat-containing protein [Saccharopolyspora sp. NPDC050389]|uniref:DUF4097 family beta strand repeat-containing protein n=1 Tax=Saccharopolyspora sp. NPDC050389 TaxID=3155516 RepID=UPI00340ECA66